uniref:Late blight resistance protein n=1 Tax=Solanum tuberosum TaxID=4113 RepID=M1D3Y0_SOLTU
MTKADIASEERRTRNRSVGYCLLSFTSKEKEGNLQGWGRFGAVGIAGLQRFWASISGIVHVAGLLEKKRKTQGWGSFGIVLLKWAADFGPTKKRGVVPVMVVKLVERSFQRHRVCSIPSSYERVMPFESWGSWKGVRPEI